MLEPDNDRALENADQDEFGFAAIAKKLAPSLVSAASGDGMVIGIEGPWGSGKSTMLNLLRQELPALQATNLHVISISPWLAGDGSSLVRTLMEAMAEVLDALEEKENAGWLNRKKKATKYGNVLREYATKTGRGVAPLAKLAGLIVPGATAVGEGLSLGAELLDKFGKAPTESDIKQAISARLKLLDVRFLVLIDDLDRLEPAQAVEVVRLVRSVADFPKVAYVMCYDRSVLASALQTGLSVADGNLFLQKVIQLTFSIPLPEPFDLRTSLREKVLRVYKDVNGRLPEAEEAEDIRLAIDREGRDLRTPRDIKLVLNGIKFAYASVADQVYFPDICRINLVKILNRPLYAWLEKYLALRSVLATGDAVIDTDERTQLGEELRALLPSDEASSGRSIWSLRRYIPSVHASKNAKDIVFSNETANEASSAISLKRLSSHQHYRFYFAMTGPKTVLSDDKYRELIALAETDVGALRNKLTDYVRQHRPLGKSWIEYIIDHLDQPHWQRLSAAQSKGMILAVCDILELAIKDISPLPASFGIGDRAEGQIRHGIHQLRLKDPRLLSSTLPDLWTNCASVAWLIGELLRTELWNHGSAGDRPQPESSHVLTAAELAEAKKILEQRLTDPALRERLRDSPGMPGFLWGWRDMSGEDAPKSWVQDYVADDDNFLKFLLQMRSWSMSDRVYYPLRKASISAFLDWDEIHVRLKAIGAANPSDVRKSAIAEITEAIELGKERDD